MRSSLCVAMLAVCLIALQCTTNGEVASSAAKDPSLSDVPPPPPGDRPPEQTAHSGPGGTGEGTDLSVGPAAAPVTTTTIAAAKPEHKPQPEEPSAEQTQQQPQQPQQPQGQLNNPNNAVEELERQHDQTERQHGDPNQSNKAPPLPGPHGGQKMDTVQDTDNEQLRPPLQPTINATVAAGAAPHKGNSASSKGPNEHGDKPPEAPPQVNDARDTNVNLPKAQALPDTNNDDNPVVEDTTKALNKPEVPAMEAPTDLTQGKAASGVPSGKSTPTSPQENDPTHSQPLTVSSSGDKSTKKGVVTSPSPPEKKETPQSAPSGGEQPQPPAQGLPSIKIKAPVNGTTHKTTAAVPTDNTLTPADKLAPTTTTGAGDAVTKNNTTTEEKKTIQVHASVTSTSAPAKEESTAPPTHLPKLSTAIQYLENKDNAIGISSLFALPVLTTLFVMAVAPAS